MLNTEFYDGIEQADNLTMCWLARAGEEVSFEVGGKPMTVVPEADSAFVHSKRTRGMFCVALAAIEKEDWKTLEECLDERRSPIVLGHMSRIVGYYSMEENWNLSKRGELTDRRNGNYMVA